MTRFFCFAFFVNYSFALDQQTRGWCSPAIMEVQGDVTVEVHATATDLLTTPQAVSRELNSASDITSQVTLGDASPAIAKVRGNVRIVCAGVSPAALEVLNRKLDQRKLDYQQKKEEAEQWARLYHELQSELTSMENPTVLTKKAENLLAAGDLEGAGRALEERLALAEKAVSAAAFARARVYTLQFRDKDAIPFYKRAYDSRPEDLRYGLGYAVALQQTGDRVGAESIYLSLLKRLQDLSPGDPVFNEYRFKINNNIAQLYLLQQAFMKAGDIIENELSKLQEATSKRVAIGELKPVEIIEPKELSRTTGQSIIDCW